MNRKYYVLILTLLLIIFIVYIFFRNSNVDYQKQYIDKLSDELNITYEKAYEIDNKQNKDVLLRLNNKNNIIKYKNIYGTYNIYGSENFVEMSVLVKYVYCTTSEQAIEIIDVKDLNLSVIDVNKYKFIDNSDPFIDFSLDKKSVRIFKISQAIFNIKTYKENEIKTFTDNDFSVGKLFVNNLKKIGFNEYEITTSIATYSLNITLGKLEN